LIDHGAALYFHHDWDTAEKFVESPFSAIRDHVLLPWADVIDQASTSLAGRLDRDVFGKILNQVPDVWLPSAKRARYLELLTERLNASTNFVEEAIRARAKLV